MMTKPNQKIREFGRDFKVELLDTHRDKPDSLVWALFDRWALPGESNSEGDQPPLRLAMRDGYLNFYANGQSVARLEPSGSSLKWTIARFYLKQAGFPVEFRETSKGTAEITQLKASDPSYVLSLLINATGERWSAEKCFVEHLVARNATIIDIEMGLPGDPSITRPNDKGEEVKVAPRMDIVLAREIDGQWRIEFWEAKMFDNPELRATLPEAGGERDPHICAQLARYEKWMNLPDRSRQVSNAYKAGATKMLELAEFARKSGKALDVWKGIESSERIEINPRPGIVIGNYSANPRKPVEVETIRRRCDSFAKHGARLVDEYNRTFQTVDSATCANAVISAPLPGDCLWPSC